MNEIPLRLSGYGSIPAPSDARAYLPPSDGIVTKILTAVAARVRVWWRRTLEAWRYAAAMRELHALDARTLKDIGLHRGDLHAVADAYARQGTVGRFGGVHVRRVGIADLPRCLQFARLLHPEDIRRRFGRLAALGDAATFRRLFGLDDCKIESVGLFDLSGQILGLATVAWVRPGTAEIALVVRSDLQRRGLGATLLANVIKDARDAGFHLLLANIGGENMPMRRLARSFGFDLVGAAASGEAQLVIRR